MSELHEFVSHMTEDERTLLLQVPTYQKVIIMTVSIATLVWGTFMKCFIYYNVSKEKMSERPINILIIIDQVIHHVLNTIFIMGSIVKVNLPNQSDLRSTLFEVFRSTKTSLNILLMIHQSSTTPLVGRFQALIQV